MINPEVDLRVEQLDDSVPGIRSVVFAAATGDALPPFGPGSHLVLTCGGQRNAYSLTGDTTDRMHYRVSIQHRLKGRGGSAWLHGSLEVGTIVTSSLPRNLFPPVQNARHSVYIAGGIGVTPLLSHLRQASRQGRSFDFVYATGPFAAHLGEVRSLAGNALHHVHGRHELASQVRILLSGQPIGAYAYICGPAEFTATVIGIARELGWPDERLRCEPFAAAPAAPGRPFTATVLSANTVVQVPGDGSLLDALLKAGIEVPHLCRQGVCGECILSVRAGRLEHRDYFLTADEKADGRHIMACVSRSESGLELEL